MLLPRHGVMYINKLKLKLKLDIRIRITTTGVIEFMIMRDKLMLMHNLCKLKRGK